MSRRRPTFELPPRLRVGRAKGDALQELLDELIGRLEPGTRLPSERDLADRYGVARMTARRELERLVARGRAYRRQGGGTYVADTRFVQPALLTSFSEDMRARGLVPGGKLLSKRVIPAKATVAEMLELAIGEPVVELERLRTANDEPIALERAHLPESRFPGLADVDADDLSLYGLLATRWGVEVHAAEQTVAAATLTAGQAAALGVRAGRAALVFERVTRDRAAVPIEYVRSLYRGDRYVVRFRLPRPAAPPAVE
jgi:GntR family transcriptional regulator